MRDYVLTIAILASLPLILRKPFLGVLVWTLLSLMNPHLLCWGFATSFPFAQLVALVLFVSLLISKEAKSIPWEPSTRVLAAWWIWMLITTALSMYPETSWDYWDRVWKILLLTFIALTLLTTPQRIHALVWVIVVSLGLYSVKGGIFTVTSGGGYHVLGPSGSFIGGNTEIGLAMVMTLPLMRYLQLSFTSKLAKQVMLGVLLLSLVAILGTQSRGALLGLIASVLFLALKGRQRTPLILALIFAVPLALMVMPESWYGRMDTIQNYEEDASAVSRINTWWTAWFFTLDHPIVGGGFRILTQRAIAAQYAPVVMLSYDAHSVYFQVLAEHGFVGLALFLALLFGTLVTLGRVTRFAKRHPTLEWMRDLSSMLSVSVIGYAVSGAFLSLAYFDYFYTLVALTISLAALMRKYLAEGVPPVDLEASRGDSDAGTSRINRIGGRSGGVLWRAREWFEKL